MTNLQENLKILVTHRRLILWDVLLVTLAVAIYSFVMPPTFTSKVQILPPTEETDVLSLASGLGAGVLSKAVRLGGQLRGSTSSDLIAAMLRSRTIQERVIDTCDFIATYRIRRGSRETALRKLRELTRTYVSDEGIVGLSVDARWAGYAARLAEAYVAELDRFLRESNMSRGRMMRIFAQERLADNDDELTVAEESLVAYQKRNRIAAVDDETKAAVETYAKLQAQKLELELELQVAQNAAGSENPYVQDLRRRAAEFGRQLSKFELGTTGGTSFGVGLAVPFRRLPDVAAEYARRLAEYRTKQELRLLLVQQYEQARMSEVRDTPAITVLDPPKVPERRSSPKRIRMTLIALIVSLVVGIILAYLVEYWERQRRDEHIWQGWLELGHALSRRPTRAPRG